MNRFRLFSMGSIVALVITSLLNTAAAQPADTQTNGTQPAKPQSILTPAEQAIILKVHNDERALAGKQPLVWDKELAAHAQAYANKLAASGELKHDRSEERRTLKQGENLHRTSRNDRTYEVNRCASKWALEKLDPNTGKSIYVPGMTYTQYGEKYPNKTYGHWTQMIWGKTQKLGVGMAQIQQGEKKGGWVTVARYYPGGNYVKQAP